MADALHYMQSILVVWTMLKYNPVLGGDTFRSSYVKFVQSCSLAEATNQTMLDSADCKYACLAKHDSGSCAAYQWDADTSTCRLQEVFNVTASSSSDSVGLLMDADETTACLDDTDCPLNHTCHVISTDCGILSASCIAADYHADCAAIRAANPDSQSGVYEVLDGAQHLQKVWCDMDTDGGGWTVFLKRQDGSVNFYQDFATYKQGFGDVHGEYWLGLDVLHSLTSARTYQLRADISDWAGSSVYSLHQSMVVASESDNFKLTLGAFTAGEGGNGLFIFDQMEFTTKDADRDLRLDNNCAIRHHGGFWYNRCMAVNPTGRYYNGGVYTDSRNYGIQWRSWDAHDDKWYSMKTVELKLRP